MKVLKRTKCTRTVRVGREVVTVRVYYADHMINGESWSVNTLPRAQFQRNELQSILLNREQGMTWLNAIDAPAPAGIIIDDDARL